MTASSEALQALRPQAQALLTQLHPLAAQGSSELQSTWAEHLDRLEELVQFLASGGSTRLALPTERAVSKAQWMEFGRLLRDKRSAAGFSRVQLARRAKLSDATIKFAETARHPPSRARSSASSASLNSSSAGPRCRGTPRRLPRSRAARRRRCLRGQGCAIRSTACSPPAMTLSV